MACTVPALAPLLGYLRRHKFARGSSSEAVVQPMEEQSERGRHQGNGDPETCENATNRNVSSMTMFGDNDNAVVMHTQETPNAPNEEGSHQYFHKIAEGAG